MKRDFLQLQGIDPQFLQALLDRTQELERAIVRGETHCRVLDGKSVVTLFYENSTRTRCSFETAAKFLGAQVVNVSVANSSVQKGETLEDTAVTLDRMRADFIVVRHAMSGAPAALARYVRASVVNGGDGLHAHPTQALLDLATMQRHFGGVSGLTVAIIGDIKHSRVARSNLYGLQALGARVKVYGPATMMPAGAERMGWHVCGSIEEAFVGSDVVMGLRIQTERQQCGLIPSAGEYNRFYGINQARMQLANPGAIVMHPGPVNRGVEISRDMFGDERLVKDEQVTFGVAARMALFEALAQA